MPFYTPLRYPGGKRRLAFFVSWLLEENGLRDVDYVEPFAGGAAIGLELLFGERASAIHINDLSRPVYAFWHTVLNETVDICRRIEKVKVTMAEWRRQRSIYLEADDASLADLGFAALFLNRTNRSGIVNGGVIGGKNQDGAWKLDARFNRQELITRIRRIGRYRTRINLSSLDAEEFTKKALPGLGQNVFVFFDPPYIEKGKDLYLNEYDTKGHEKLAASIATVDRPWLVTYDTAAVKLGLFPHCRRLTYSLSYSAQHRYKGSEVMFFSPRLQLPREWLRRRNVTLSPSANRFPLSGRLEAVHPFRTTVESL